MLFNSLILIAKGLFVDTLLLLAKGMIAIFIVMGVIFIITKLLNKYTHPKEKE